MRCKLIKKLIYVRATSVIPECMESVAEHVTKQFLVTCFATLSMLSKLGFTSNVNLKYCEEKRLLIFELSPSSADGV